MSTQLTPTQALTKVRTAFNAFNKDRMDVLDQFYATNAVFQDPVVRVESLARIKKYYAHVYSSVKSIRFEFTSAYANDEGFAMPWQMTLSVAGLNGGAPYSVDGLSIFQFDQAGLVTFHRDYVDISAMVYEKIPVFGAVVRQIKNRLHPAEFS